MQYWNPVTLGRLCCLLTLSCFLSTSVYAVVSDKLKPSSIRSNAQLKEQKQALIDALGPVPFPDDFKVAYADKNPLRSKIVSTQTPVTAREAMQVIKDNPDIVIYDVRLPELYADEHIPGAINVPFVQPHHGFVRDLAKLDPSQTILIYCSIGHDTGKARLGFGAFGFTKVYAMRDGIRAWIEAGGPTEGPKQGTTVEHLGGIPELVVPKVRPTRPARSARDVEDGPFPTIPVSYDFAKATDFSFDGRGHVIGTIITFMVRRRADVVAGPYRVLPDPRYPREHIKNKTGILVLEADKGHRDHMQYRADGTVLSTYQPSRGDPASLRCITAKDNGRKVKSSVEEKWLGLGIVGIHTDVTNNVWCARWKKWIGRNVKGAKSEPTTVSLIKPDDSVVDLTSNPEWDLIYNLVHDARRSLLYFTEPLEKRLWVLPVDVNGENVGEARPIAEFDEQPWGLTLDEFGNVYVSVDPNILRLRTDEHGQVIGKPVRINQDPIDRIHMIHFGHGPGFEERSLYAMCNPRQAAIIGDPMTGYVTGTYKEDGSASNRMENSLALMSEFVRLDLGVRGAPETLVTVPEESVAPEPHPDGTIEDIEEKRAKLPF